MQLKKTTFIITHRQFFASMHQYDKESLPNIVLVKKHYSNVNYPSHCLLSRVSAGSFVEALQGDECQKALSYKIHTRERGTNILLHYKQNLQSYLENSDSNAQQVVLCIGISFLQLFTQNNFCGPIVGPPSSALLPGLIPEDSNDDDVRNDALKELVLDAEGVYTLLTSPEYLILARIVFYEMKALLSSCSSVNWWCCRYGIIHQKVADEQSPIIYETLIEALHNTENNSDLVNETEFRDIAALFHLEAGHLHLHYSDVGKAKLHFDKLLLIVDMEINLTGALGKRTKWQQQELAQLVVKVAYKDKPIMPNELPGPSLLLSDLPKDVILNDDTRLNTIQYTETDEDVIPNLRPIEQMALLAYLILKRKSQAHDLQLNEETKSYLMAILQYPKNWCLQLTALIMRSRVESTEFRALERTMNQYEELVNAVYREEPSRHERLKLVYCSMLLPQWSLQQELARTFMKLGCTKTALEIFERLQLWEDVIICYNELQMRQRSADIIKSLIEKEESPKLWCLLGDATDDVECFHKAWILSGERSGRAQRCLGNYYYVHRDYRKAIEHYEKSVEINSLQFSVWQRMAYCGLQTEDWEKCALAYRKCSVLEPDNFECWNNMSQAYLKLGQTFRAWKSLQEALRCEIDNWRVWDNYMLVSTSLGYIIQALNAYNRILMCKEKHIDTEILGRIVNAVIENKKDPDGNELKSLHKKSIDLLGRLTREVPTHPELWFLYAELVYNHPDISEMTKHTAMQHYRKSVAAASQKPGWENDTNNACLVLMRALRLLHVAQEVSQESNSKAALADLSSIRMLIKGCIATVKRCQVNIETGLIVENVQVPLQEVETELQNVNNIIDQLRS